MSIITYTEICIKFTREVCSKKCPWSTWMSKELMGIWKFHGTWEPHLHAPALFHCRKLRTTRNPRGLVAWDQLLFLVPSTPENSFVKWSICSLRKRWWRTVRQYSSPVWTATKGWCCGTPHLVRLTNWDNIYLCKFLMESSGVAPIQKKN